jgi:hypothetical protein
MRRALKRTFGAVSWLYAAGIVPLFFIPLALILPAAFLVQRRAVWASILPPVVVFTLLYGQLFMPPCSIPSEIETTSLTIMSFNIWGYSRSEATARAILEDGTPDIVALQELAPDMAEVLVRELGDIYPALATMSMEWEYSVGFP